MSFDRLRDFTGRDEEIAAFDSLWTGDEPIALMIDGFSGTGKSTLAEWLRKYRCRDRPSCFVRLQPELAPDLLLTEIVEALNPDGAEAFQTQVEAILAENQPVNVSYSPTQTIEATWKGEVSGVNQTAGDLHLHVDQLTKDVESRRAYRMLRAASQALAPLADRAWVLFLDETEHLDDPTLGRLVLGQLLSTLRRRFPQARFVFTGQRIPTSALEPHEYVRRTLEVFDRSTACGLMEKVGLKERARQERAYQLTGGHPLLLGMLFQAGLPAAVDASNVGEGMSRRTRWIYQRVIERLPDGPCRDIAADLALFEWFDMELLRQVFEVDLTEAEFRHLADRAFVKPLSGGRWTCHDIVRLHLPPERRQLDPEAFRAVHLATVNALRSRIEELPASSSGRLPYVAAILHSLQAVDTEEARLEAHREVASAFAFRHLENAFGLARHVRQSKFEPWGSDLARRIENGLSYVTTESAGADYAHFLAGLASVAGGPRLTDALLFEAGTVALEAGDLALAGRLAREALDGSDDPSNYGLNAEVLAAAGQQDLARDCLAAARARHGDLPTFALTEVMILLRSGDEEGAWQKLTEAVAAFPDDATARRVLAWRALTRGRVEAARAQLDVLKRLTPLDPDVHELECVVLEKEGRLLEAAALVNSDDGRLSASMAHQFETLVRAAQDPAVAANIESRLMGGGDDVTFVEAQMLAAAASRAGQVERTDRIVQATLKHWPEFEYFAPVHRGLAYLNAGRPEDAASVLERPVLVGTTMPEAAVVLVRVLAFLGDTQRVRTVLSKLVTPRLRDVALAVAATAMAQAGQPAEALETLREHASDGRLGPCAQMARAEALLAMRAVDEAIESLELLVNTYGASDAPRFLMMRAYTVLGTTLAKKGDADRAREVAKRVSRISRNDETGLEVQLAIYWALKDAAAVRDLMESHEMSHSLRDTSVMGMAAVLVESGASLEELLQQLRQNPERVELVFAIDGLMTRQPPADIAGVVAEIDALAPGVFVILEELRAAALTRMGPAAIDSVRQQIEMDPGNLPLRIGMIALLLHNKRLEEAAEQLADLEAAPATVREVLRGRIAGAYISAGRLPEASALLEDVLNAEVPNPVLLDTAARLLAVQEDGAGLARLLRRGLAHAGDLRANLLARAAALLAPYDAEQASEYVEELGRTSNMSAGNRLSYARTLRLLGRCSEAIAVLQSVAESHGTNVDIEDELGRCHQEIGAHRDAIVHFERAVELSPNTAYVYTALSRSLEAEGHTQAAYETLRIAVAIDPDLFAANEERLRLLMPRKALTPGR